MTECLLAALAYASRGWRVIPLTRPPRGDGKKPLLTNWTLQASNDPIVIDQWWQQWPEANVGIVTGKASGLVVLDVDPKNGGDESLLDQIAANGPLPNTVECLTGGGGRHLYFQYPGQLIQNSAGLLGPGLDIRGDGGQVVAPPSVHKSGNRYVWEASSDPMVAPIAPLPDWIARILLANGSQKSNQSQSPMPSKKVGRGARNRTLTSLAGSMRRRGFDQAAIEQALLLHNQQHCHPPLTDAEVLTIARSVTRYNPARPPTDDELADNWLKQYPDTAYGLGEFRRYKNGCWPVVTLKQVECEILPILEDAKGVGVKPSAWKMKSVMELARIKSQIDDQKWDANPDILVCKNGTLEIPNRSIRGHEKTDYCTSRVEFDYDARATAPTWERFFQQRIPEAAFFLQEFAGYALTTDTQFELAVWLFGPPGCGKSTFIEGMLSMLGERAGLVGLADIERSRFGLDNVAGKTLLYATEQPAMFMQASNVVNALISGEMVKIDRKFREPLTLVPRAKLLWAMNELPRIPEAGSGLFRRVKVVEFPALEEKKRDPKVKAMIKNEGAGILNWALDGLDALRQDHSFSIPSCVREATDQFQKANDVPAAFIEDQMVRDLAGSISASQLYDAYRNWCIANGHKPQSSTSLAMDWKRLGFSKRHTMMGWYYEGLKSRT